MERLIRTCAHSLLTLALPCCCALCGKLSGAAVVCAACITRHIDHRTARCMQCANLVEAPRRLCGQCISTRRQFDATVAGATYAAPLDSLVLQLKFAARLPLAPWMAATIRDALLARPDLRLPNLLCPVPLGPQRLCERGFNQALEIARPLAAGLGIPLQPMLAIRTRETAAQSSLEPGERAANIRNAFVVHPAHVASLRGLHIGIVDDVMSSGHTIDELAGLLRRSGASRISVLIFARTPLR